MISGGVIYSRFERSMPEPTTDFQEKILHFATRRTIPSPTVGIPQRKSCETATKFRRFWVKEPPSFRKKIYSRKKVYLNTSMVADFFSRSDVYFSPMCLRCLATHGFVYWGLACIFSYVGCVTSCGISGVRSPQKPITTTTPYNAAWACSRLRVLRAVENRARVLLGIVRRQAAICTGAFFDIFWLGVSTREACGF